MSRRNQRIASYRRDIPPAAVKPWAKIGFDGKSTKAETQKVRDLLAVAVLPVFLGFAYYRPADLAVPLLGAIALAAFMFPAARSCLRASDWGMLLVLMYEIPSLLLSRYPANGLRAGMTLCVAALFYFLVRLVAHTPRQAVLIAALIGVGGVALAGFALVLFNEQIHLLRANGFLDVVAFRARLITPPPPWVLGEWFTLVLLTLPFAFAVPVFIWFEGRRIPAMIAALVPLGVVAGLLLSCSRAVFWGLIVFIVFATGTSAIYRIIRAKVALIAMLSLLCVLGLVLAGENAIYPGVAAAYIGRQKSQVRSTEGRLAIWKRSADVFRMSPLWGVGSGNAPLFLTSNADREETIGFASRTFSLPLQVLTEKGAAGAALYLAVLLLAGWEAHRKLRNPKISRRMKTLTCCLVAGVVAVLFRELTYSSLFEHAATAMLFTTSLALLAVEELT